MSSLVPVQERQSSGSCIGHRTLQGQNDNLVATIEAQDGHVAHQKGNGITTSIPKRACRLRQGKGRHALPASLKQPPSYDHIRACQKISGFHTTPMTMDDHQNPTILKEAKHRSPGPQTRVECIHTSHACKGKPKERPRAPH